MIRNLLNNNLPEPLLNDAQAAEFLGGLHPKTVQRMARRKEIPSYRVGKYYRYRASELDSWLRAQKAYANITVPELACSKKRSI